MSAVPLQSELTSKKKRPLNAWAIFILLAVAAAVAACIAILATHPHHPLGIGGTVAVFLGVAYTGLGITISYRNDVRDIIKLEDVKAKLKAEEGSKTVLHNKLDELLDVLVANAKDRKSNGINQLVAFGISVIAAGAGTVLLILDLMYA
jgi:hypothetical protein